MAKIGMVGMGKLGAPVALAIESQWHDVIAYDKNPAIEEAFKTGIYPHKEDGVPELIGNSKIKFASSIGEVVANSEIIFLPIQTPHDLKYEGTTRIPVDRKDFDYSALEVALADVANECGKLGVRRTVAVISTCLPGTYEEKLKPILNIGKNVDYVYTPQFIAMGTVIEDYLYPEFNLIGVESEEAADKMEEFYGTINGAPCVRTDIKTAEGIKVSYNTWITAKTVIANAWGELAEKTGMNFTDIKRAWDLSTKRLISPKYTDAGMSDGGGCHPRDNIAMSWLADKVDMSHNIWEDLMEAREQYEEWHARLAYETSVKHNLPLVLLGKSFKPETKIETGSPAILMSSILKEHGVIHQHYEDMDDLPQKAVYFISTQHDRYNNIKFPNGSVVIDPFGYLEPQDGVIIKHIGRQNGRNRNTSKITTKYTES